jgi:predicted phage terminase large subunit-like protein
MMSTTAPSLTTCWPAELPFQAGLLLRGKVRRCRLYPDEFAEFCFSDETGRPLRQGQVHRDLQAFLGDHPRALVELPRDHGKSVQVCVRILWELGRDPTLRVKIVCASDDLAAQRSRFLREAIAQNRRLRMVFPDLEPARPWEATGFTVRRPANVIGPSVAALGVGAASTGSRADLLVCDDIVDVKALRSRADRERVKAYFRENLMNLLEPGGRFWGLSTPWHPDDLNSDLKQNAAYALFRRPVGDELQPVWPERWPAERLAERHTEIGSLAFARAYRLVCIPEEDVTIQARWVQFWTEPAAPERIVLSVDPAVSCKSGADCSALVTLARTAANEIRCLEAVARRVAAPDLVGLIADADRRWHPDVILFESNAAFGGIGDLLVRHAAFGPKIREVRQIKDKASRAHAFSVPVENGTFRLQGADALRVHPGQQALFDEMTSFPFGEHDDLLDAAATGTAYLLDRPEPRVW